MPVVLDAVIQQVSRTAVDQSMLAAAQAADQEAAMAAALENVFPNSSGAHADETTQQHHSKKAIYEGDIIAESAAGITTGSLQCTACKVRLVRHDLLPLRL